MSGDLINPFVAMIGQKRLVYIPLERATKKELAVGGSNVDLYFVENEMGALTEMSPDEATPVDLSTDLRVELAFETWRECSVATATRISA